MSERGSSIILERSKYGIGVDLITRAVQETAAVVTTDVVAVRSDRASVVRDVRDRRIQNAIPNL